MLLASPQITGLGSEGPAASRVPAGAVLGGRAASQTQSALQEHNTGHLPESLQGLFIFRLTIAVKTTHVELSAP